MDTYGPCPECKHNRAYLGLGVGRPECPNTSCKYYSDKAYQEWMDVLAEELGMGPRADRDTIPLWGDRGLFVGQPPPGILKGSVEHLWDSIPEDQKRKFMIELRRTGETYEFESLQTRGPIVFIVYKIVGRYGGFAYGFHP